MFTGKKLDTEKPRMADFYPDISKAFEAFVDVAEYGAKKYGEGRVQRNWQNLPNAIPRFKNALMRHVHSYMSGEIIDVESGKSHLAHIIWNCAILLILGDRGNTIDWL